MPRSPPAAASAGAGSACVVWPPATDPSELSYAAFYADCEHEVLPVRRGNRVCLVHNLIHKRSKGRNRILRAPEYEHSITRTAAILDHSLIAPDAPPKIAWLLDHQYSPAGLSFSALKGSDAAKARVLVQAAARAQCTAHLGIVHIGESGAAEPDDDSFYGSRRNRYGYDEDGDDEESDEDASFSAATVDDNWQYVDEWRDTEDRVAEFGRIPLAAGELLPAGALDGEPPDEKRLLAPITARQRLLFSICVGDSRNISRGHKSTAALLVRLPVQRRSGSETAFRLLESDETRRTGYAARVEWKVEAGGSNGPARSLPPF